MQNGQHPSRMLLWLGQDLTTKRWHSLGQELVSEKGIATGPQVSGGSSDLLVPNRASPPQPKRSLVPHLDHTSNLVIEPHRSLPWLHLSEVDPDPRTKNTAPRAVVSLLNLGYPGGNSNPVSGVRNCRKVSAGCGCTRSWLSSHIDLSAKRAFPAVFDPLLGPTLTRRQILEP